MGKKSKSKRFVQHGKNSVEKHAERFPYRSTFAEAELKRNDESLGGI
ncbi:competence protein [Lederbergia panacisoli]|nr:competence protein [Lederbergia panacisoli]MCR2821000.1 competence protein [Lederbergia panacisoli]